MGLLKIMKASGNIKKGDDKGLESKTGEERKRKEVEITLSHRSLTRDCESEVTAAAT